MRNRRWFRPLAAALCLAMAMTVVPFTGEGARAVTKSEQPEQDTTLQNELKAAIKKLDIKGVADIKETMRLQTLGLVEEQKQEALFVIENMDKKTVRCGSYDIDNNSIPELFVLHNDKKLEVYDYSEDMLVDGKSIKPIFTMKNVAEVRTPADPKGSFTVKQIIGKQTVITICTYTPGSVKKGDVYSSTGPKKDFTEGIYYYNSLKKLKMSKPNMSRDRLYEQTDISILNPETCMRSIAFEGTDLAGSFIMRHDKEPDGNLPAYRVFGEVEKFYHFRTILGQEEAEDYDSLLDELLNPVNAYPAFIAILNDDPAFVVSDYTPADKDTPAYYTVDILGDDGSVENDFFCYVENVKGETHLTRLENVLPNGLIYDRLEISYGGDLLNKDTKDYISDHEELCYPGKKYLDKHKYSDIRTITVNYSDRTETLKTRYFVKFLTYTKHGRFSIRKDEKTIDVSEIEFDSKIVEILNPFSGNGYGFAEPFSELTWTAPENTPQ
ncbi:MAG: hypothetical protein IKQ97_09410 [Eubacterium sp.]|nr:hypothetical protein [Eubacterium sp.]